MKSKKRVDVADDPRQYGVRVVDLRRGVQPFGELCSTASPVRLQPSLGAARARAAELRKTHDRVTVMVYDQFRGKWSVVNDEPSEEVATT